MTSAAARVRFGTLLGNSAWSLLGQLLPAIVGFLLVPRIVAGFGDARFGLLSLAWAVIGYLSFLDLGISRAVTKSVASSLAHARFDELRVQVWSALALMVAVGVAASVALFPLANWISMRALEMPATLREESVLTVQLLAIGLPITLLMNGLRGVLEAYQRFGLVNIVRLPFGVATFVIPWMTLGHSHSVALVIAWLMVARLIAVVAYAVMCILVMREHARPCRPTRHAIRAMLSYGAWITVSNVVGPLMVSFDRFIIGSLISVALVTYYVTPYQIATQFLILPTAISTVLFPAFATLWDRNRDSLRLMYTDVLRAIFAAMLSAGALIVAIAPQLLGAWLGGRFTGPSTTPLRLLMVGVVLNGVAQLAFTLIQSAGRSDWTAKLHLLEAPFYLVALVLCAKRFGLTGVAAVWCLRTLIDLVVLYVLAAELAEAPRVTREIDAACLVAGLGALAVVALPDSGLVRLLLALAIGAGCAFVGYTKIIGPARARLLRDVLAPAA